MTPEIKRLRAETDKHIRTVWMDTWEREPIRRALSSEREARDALLRDILQGAGAVVQEARHHELMPWFGQKIEELERVTTIGGKA